MTKPKDDSPRRYFVDGNGNRVLIGLTIEETFEFETLDNRPALDERRWLELYGKHDSAWGDWKTKIQADRRETSDFVNYH